MKSSKRRNHVFKEYLVSCLPSRSHHATQLLVLLAPANDDLHRRAVGTVPSLYRYRTYRAQRFHRSVRSNSGNQRNQTSWIIVYTQEDRLRHIPDVDP